MPGEVRKPSALAGASKANDNRAYVFAAGLILGFAHFVQPSGDDVEVEEVFRHCCAVEQRLAALSPQAGYYYEILGA